MLVDRNTVRMALQALSHPVSVLAVVSLLVNDHVLKSAFPGVITGKLSDFAGLLFFPLLLTVLAGLFGAGARLAINGSVAVTAIWFTAMKTISPVTSATEHFVAALVGSSQIIRDVTDLIALPILAAPLFLFWSRREHSPSRSGVTRRRAEMAILIAGAFASMATSCYESDGAVSITDDGSQVVFNDDYYYMYTSTDGFDTFTRSSDPADVADERATEACLEDGTCFRISGGAFVEESTDGVTWTRAWTLPAGRVGFLERYGDSCDPYEVRSRDIAVAGDTVLVAMGDDGLLRRLPDGTWQRDVLGTAKPFEELGANLTPELLFASGLAMALLLLAALLAKSRFGDDVDTGNWAAVGMILLGVTAFALMAGSGSDMNGQLVALLAVVPGLLGLAALTSVWSRLRRSLPGPTSRAAATSTLVSLVTVGAGLGPFYAWSGGLIDQWETAAIMSIAIVVMGILGLRALFSHSEKTLPPSNEAASVPTEGTLEQVPPSPSDEAAPVTAADMPVRVPPPPSEPTPTTHPWAAAAVLSAALLVPFARFPLSAVFWLGAAYLAARWSGHAAPVSRMLVGAAAAIVGYVTSLSLAGVFVSTWALSVATIRAPNRAAVAFRVISGGLGVFALRSLRHNEDVWVIGASQRDPVWLALAWMPVIVPFLVVAGDHLAMWWHERRSTPATDQSETESTTS